MADNKLLLKRDSDEDFLAENDPLAELARIVGFDPSPSAKAMQPAQRREPAFDLEDELLKELEIYAQPAAAEIASAVVPTVEPVAVEPEREIPPSPESAAPAIPEVDTESADVAAREPAILEAVETFADGSDGRVYERPASHPVFDLEDEILREFAAFDARHVSRGEEHVVEAEVVHQDPPRAAPPVELHDVPDGRSMTPAPISHRHGRDIYESFRADDLDDAISNALSPVPEQVAADVRPSVPEEEIVPRDVEDVAARPSATIEEKHPHAASGATDGDVAVPEVETQADQGSPDVFEPASADAAFVEPSIEDFAEPRSDEPAKQDFTDHAPMTQATSQPGDRPQPAILPVTDQAAAQPSADNYGLDALLAEVERYPVGDSSGRWGVQSKSIAAEELARAAPPVVQDFTPLAAAGVEHDDEAIFENGNFEIDLGDIDLDLSDINEVSIDASPALLAELADAPVTEPEPVFRQITPRGADNDYSTLPFDPSQVVQDEEVLEAIAEMDVPEVPAVHEEEKPAPHPEYDIDVDAEMAQLFATATAQSTTAGRPGGAGDAAVNIAGTQRGGSPPASLDLDEFERALEEDFRRSFAENRTGSSPDRVALAPVYAEPRQGRSRRSAWLLASAAVAVALFGGAGVYAFMSGDAEILTSSEPKVILADTDPVKVVPENPGGKQVPNQDKAVYDRVSGARTEATKQESLVTSNEEPVDVVQRTLMPETLPMDDDSMALATPTGDTIDPRLLPDDEEKDRVTTTSKVVSGVSPRKVKTMVVRSDGTLVEREVTEDDLKQQAANDAELMKIAQKAAQDAATANDSQSDDIAKAIENVPERLAPSDETAARPVETKIVKAEDVQPAAPVDTNIADVEPVRIEGEQPAVADKPTDTAVAPVEAVDAKPTVAAQEEKPAEVATGNPVEAESKPVEILAADKPVERSIDVETQQPILDQETAAKVADVEVADGQAEDAPVRKVKTTKITPVPQVRPADQPVTVVGTVTDQGTVRSDVDAKPQNVALADTSTKPALPAGSYVIQIASLPSEAEAQTSYSRLSAKFAGIIGGRGVDIRKAEIKNKGTYYRVRIPAGSKQEAQALCSQYKKAGGSCLVSK